MWEKIEGLKTMELQNSTDKMEKRLQAVSVTFFPFQLIR